MICYLPGEMGENHVGDTMEHLNKHRGQRQRNPLGSQSTALFTGEITGKNVHIIIYMCILCTIECRMYIDLKEVIKTKNTHR